MMKKNILFLIILIVSNYSCNDGNTDIPLLEISESEFSQIDGLGDTIEVSVSCKSTWKATSSTSWCSLTPETGVDNQKIQIAIEPNETSSTRTATISVVSGGSKKDISIGQNIIKEIPQSYRYTVPLYCHVYDHNSKQTVSDSQLDYIIGKVNEYYEKYNMNLTFTIAKIDHISTTAKSISCELLMNSVKGSSYFKQLQDPNKYINVFLYNFTESNLLGISNMPMSYTGSSLEGLSTVDFYPVSFSQIGNMYCSSINSIYINEGIDKYSPNGIIETIAHELGHYLGLWHTFAENENGEMLDNCSDTDYCQDTPSYNRPEYEKWLNSLTVSQTLARLSLRSNCQGDTFTANNIMDYAYTLTYEFTPDQYKRVRHVLMYSPMIPGPKIAQSSSKAASDRTLETPFRIIK